MLGAGGDGWLVQVQADKQQLGARQETHIVPHWASAYGQAQLCMLG